MSLRFFLALGMAIWTSATGQADGFFRIGNIDGDSTEFSHPGWSAFDSTSFLLYRPKGSRSVQVAIASLVKPLDKASPLLHQACASGETFKALKIDLTAPIAGGRQLIIYQLILGNARITAVNQSGQPAQIRESLSFEFSKVSWTSRLVDLNGRILEKGAFWDVARNLGGEFSGSDFQVYGLTVEDGSLKLAWPAQAGQKFKVMGSSKVEGPYSLVQEIAAIETGALEAAVPTTHPAFFFHVLRDP